eukprot:jgi/Botrbrau1/12117/Bobra.0186s0035.1
MLPGWHPTSGAGLCLRISSSSGNRNVAVCCWDLKFRTSSIPINVSANLYPHPSVLRLPGRVHAHCVSLSTGASAPLRLGQSPWRGARALSRSLKWEGQRWRVSRGQRVIVYAKDDKNVRRGQPNRPWGPWSWIKQKASSIKAQLSLRVVFNVMMLFLLMRLWPIGGRSPVGDPSHTWEVPFSEFIQRIRTNEVSAVAIDDRRFTFTVKKGSDLLQRVPESSGQSARFSTLKPADYPTPYEQMLTNSVQFSAMDKRHGAFFSIVVYGLYIGLLLSALNRLPLKLPQRGAGRRHLGTQPQQTITFSDVAGVDEAKEELAEIVELLRNPDKFTKLGARAPSGVLLVGPPGTGKTLLAKAVAGEANVPFFSISASEFVELYVGMGAMRVRELFASARKEAPSIVFIDEIDAVAKGRDSRLRSVGNDEREQTLNQLLTELDGFESDKEAGPVICIAATNRPDVLDSALLRPGRFDRRVAVERPDRQGRQEILRVHIERRNLPLSEGVSIEDIAAMTTGFTGADLANLVNEAALLAGRNDQGSVRIADFDAAVLRSVAGIEKKRSILQGVEKSTVARHEAGHALLSTAIAAIIPGSAQVEKLSIIPRSGGALGFTYIPAKTEDRALMFESEIRGQLAMLMGGRAAEEVTCRGVSTGAVDDIRRATDLALRAVSEYGLSALVGPVSMATLVGGGSEDLPVLRTDSGIWLKQFEGEVRALGRHRSGCGAGHSGSEWKEARGPFPPSWRRLSGLTVPVCKPGSPVLRIPRSLREFCAPGASSPVGACAESRETLPDRAQNTANGSAFARFGRGVHHRDTARYQEGKPGTNDEEIGPTG